MYINGHKWDASNGINLIECDRKKQRYYGFNLQVGYVYGYDAQGRFVCPMIHDASKRAGLNSRLMLYRENPNGGWRSGWEQNLTTREIMQFTGKKKPTKAVTREWNVNPLAQVPRKHRHVLVFK